MKKRKMSLAQKINILRASVMGANDGILSVAGIVLGVAGATSDNFAIFISGFAGMLAGTVSMAMGEYVSVNTQKDTQRMAIQKEKRLLKDNYQQEFDFVEQNHLKTGMKEELAKKATAEMMEKDALTTAVRERFSFDINKITSPYTAAIASMISFPTGSLLPLASILLIPAQYRVISTFIAVIIALSITGYVAASLGNANKIKSLVRNVVAGIVTMIITYLIGTIIN